MQRTNTFFMTIPAVAILSIALLGATNAYGLGVTGKVNIVTTTPTCGLATPNPTLDYGSLAINDISIDEKLPLQNTGSSSANVNVKGTDWIGGPTAQTIQPVSTTHFGDLPGKDYFSKLKLETFDQLITSLAGGEVKDTFWMLQAQPSQAGFTGSLSQAVTLTENC